MALPGRRNQPLQSLLRILLQALTPDIHQAEGILRAGMAVSGGNLQITAGGDPVVRLDARARYSNTIVIGHAQLRIHHDAQPVLVALVGIIGVGHAQIIGKCRRIITRIADG